jgi:hypothetical protein
VWGKNPLEENNTPFFSHGLANGFGGYKKRAETSSSSLKLLLRDWVCDNGDEVFIGNRYQNFMG